MKRDLVNNKMFMIWWASFISKMINNIGSNRRPKEIENLVEKEIKKKFKKFEEFRKVKRNLMDMALADVFKNLS